MNELIKYLSVHLNPTWWHLQVFFIVLMSMLVHYVGNRVYARLIPKLEKTWTIWDDSLLYALHKPFGFMVWVLGITIAGSVVAYHSGDFFIVAKLLKLNTLILIFAIAWFLVRFTIRLENRYETKPHNYRIDRTTLHALGQMVRAAIIISTILISLQSYGVNISTVLAFGGIGGIAIGFAAKDMLANFFGGLMIYLDRPFSVGDWVRSPDKNIEGTVEHVGWRLTRIRTFDKRPLYVPNGTFSTISVENPSRMTNRRIHTVIGLRYEDAHKVGEILKDIEEMLRNHAEIDASKTLMVNLIEFASSALNFMIYTFTKTTDWVKFQNVQQDVFLKVLDIIAQHGAQCAFPTSTLHIPDGVMINNSPVES